LVKFIDQYRQCPLSYFVKELYHGARGRALVLSRAAGGRRERPIEQGRKKMSTLPVSRFHPVLVTLHWLLAFLIIADLTIGMLVLAHIPNDVPRKIEGLRAHMSAGVAILVLMLLRLTIRLATARPPDAPTGSAVLDRLAWLSHRLLYVVVFGLAGSGLIMGLQAHLPEVVFSGHGKLPESFWVYPLRGVHFFFARLLIALIALHLAGALYHSFIRRDQLLRRMSFGFRGHENAAAAAAARSDAGGFWHYASWLTRFILAPPAVLFAVIGWKYLSDPLEVAAGSGTILGSPAAVTDSRAMGAIFLALAALTILALVSERRVLAGLAMVATVDAFVTGARLLGVIIDGTPQETMSKLVAELVLLTLMTAGVLIELRRRRRLGVGASLDRLELGVATSIGG
jgi:cytochrome b561